MYIRLLTDGMDYQGGVFPVVFNPGETKKSVVIPSLDDKEPEFRECYKVLLTTTKNSSLCGAVVGEGDEQRVCLIDNDAITVVFDPDMYEVNESAGGVKVFLKTSNTAVQNFMIQIVCENGTEDDRAVGKYVCLNLELVCMHVYMVYAMLLSMDQSVCVLRACVCT